MNFKTSTIISLSILCHATAAPVASWKFDSNSKKLDDYGPKGHHIQMIGNAAKFGKKGFDEKTKYATEITGIEDTMMLIQPHEDFNSPSFSFVAHAMSAVKKDGKYRAVFYARQKDGFALYMSPRGNWELWTKGGGISWHKHIISEVTENQWEQFTVSYNADQKNPENPSQGQLQIWLNGELKVDTYTEYKPAKSKLSIGSNTVGTANFIGLIDNIDFNDAPLLAFKSRKYSLPGRIIEEETEIAALKLNSLNFDFNTKFKLTGSGSIYCHIKNGKLVLNSGADLTGMKEFKVTIKASEGKSAKDCTINYTAPIAASTASAQ